MTSVLGIGITAAPGAPDCSTLGFVLDRIEPLEVSHVELSTYENDLIVGGKIQKANLQRLKQSITGRRFAYSVHGPLSINFFDDAFRLPRHLDVLKSAIEIAAEVGAQHYVLHSGLTRMQQQAGIEAAYDRQRQWFRSVAEFAGGHQVIVCVENLFAEPDGSVYASSPSRLAQEIAAVDHANLRATLDVSHAYQQAQMDGLDFLKEIAALAPYAKHVHMHDSFGFPDDIWTYTDGEKLAFGHGDLHLPVGWGSIPWDEVRRVCRFPDAVLFNIELKQRYWYAAEECIANTSAFANNAPKRKAA